MFLNQRDILKKGIREDPVGKITFKEYTVQRGMIYGKFLNKDSRTNSVTTKNCRRCLGPCQTSILKLFCEYSKP